MNIKPPIAGLNAKEMNIGFSMPKKPTIWIWITVVVLILAGIGYYIYTQNQNEDA